MVVYGFDDQQQQPSRQRSKEQRPFFTTLQCSKPLSVTFYWLQLTRSMPNFFSRTRVHRLRNSITQSPFVTLSVPLGNDDDSEGLEKENKLQIVLKTPQILPIRFLERKGLNKILLNSLSPAAPGSRFIFTYTKG